MTVSSRVQRQGMSLLAALIMPDRKGNFLRPLTPEKYEAEARTYRREHTHIWRFGGCNSPHKVVIETTRGSIELGSYATEPEAALALTTAMTLLSSEWGLEDHIPVDPPVPATQVRRITSTVEERVSAKFPELAIGPNAEVAFALDQDTAQP